MMGGTLPALARHLIGRVEDTRREVASLYALNSFGAVLGAGMAGFVALPALGIYGALAVASLANLLAGAVLLRSARREPTQPTHVTDVRASGRGKQDRGAGPAGSYAPEQYLVALVALALSGFAAMGYEVLFSRVIALAFGASTYSFSVMLMSFITGIALGSAIIARRRVRDPLWLFGASQLAVVCALLLATPLVARLPYLIGLLRIALQDAGAGFELFQLGKAALCLAVLLLPTTCLGFGFPLVAQIQVKETGHVGGAVGSTYAWNTLGNVLGSILTGIALLPALGVLGAFHFNLALNLVAGLALVSVSRRAKLEWRVGFAAVVCIVMTVYGVAGTGWTDSLTLAHSHLVLRKGPDASLDAASRARHPASSFRSWREAFVAGEETPEPLLVEEDAHTTVLVTGAGSKLVLYVNGKADASTISEDMETQLILAHAPLFLALEARSACVIGYGSGVTLGSILQHPLESVDLVEISRGVLRAHSIFAPHNYDALDDPRVRVYEDDGLSFLRTTPRRYDVIISEPSNPWMAGIADLFTVEFFETVRGRLNPGGVFTFWFHTYYQSDATIQLVLRTLAAVFPHASVFADDDEGNLIILASEEPLQPDFAGMERRFSDPGVRDDLARLGMMNLAGLLTHHRFSETRFRGLLGEGPVNRSSHQRLEYAAPRSFFFGEHSFFVERRDSMIRPDGRPADLLLDRYIADRRAANRPLSRQSLMEAARYVKARGGYGERVSRSVLARIGTSSSGVAD
jgi:spermidine synthase